ncbi:MAG: hypothetical protein ACTSRC_09805 [Candidatus Helarchaeota archaeon]
MERNPYLNEEVKMDIPEMREFENNPTLENARKLGIEILKASGRLDEKRILYVKALEKVQRSSRSGHGQCSSGIGLLRISLNSLQLTSAILGGYPGI